MTDQKSSAKEPSSHLMAHAHLLEQSMRMKLLYTHYMPRSTLFSDMEKQSENIRIRGDRCLLADSATSLRRLSSCLVRLLKNDCARQNGVIALAIESAEVRHAGLDPASRK